MSNQKLLYLNHEGVTKECYFRYIGQRSIIDDRGILTTVVAVIADIETGKWLYVDPSRLINPKINT